MYLPASLVKFFFGLNTLAAGSAGGALKLPPIGGGSIGGTGPDIGAHLFAGLFELLLAQFEFKFWTIVFCGLIFAPGKLSLRSTFGANSAA